VVHKQAIVRIAEARTERIGRAQRRVGRRGTIAFGHRLPPGSESAAKLRKRRPVMEGNMVSLGALDLILRNIGAGMMGIAFDIEGARVHADDRAADAPRLGIPTHAIADFEVIRHDDSTCA
jgi:hypothetical protein